MATTKTTKKKRKKTLDKRQELFLANYTNPNSKTFGNAKRSAIQAGYTEQYADTVTAVMPEWLSDNIRRLSMLDKAERNLKEVQDLQIVDDEGKVSGDILRERNKVDTFMAKTIGKQFYSERTEVTGANGGPVEVSHELKQQIDAALDDVV